MLWYILREFKIISWQIIKIYVQINNMKLRWKIQLNGYIPMERSFNIFNMLKPFRVLVLLDGQIILFLKLTSRTLQKIHRDLSSHLCFLLVRKDFLDLRNSSKSGVTCFSRNLWFLLLKVVLKDHNTGAGSIHCYMTILSVGKTIN